MYFVKYNEGISNEEHLNLQALRSKEKPTSMAVFRFLVLILFSLSAGSDVNT